MSTADFESGELEALARFELLQGVLEDAPADLGGLYGHYGAADDPWPAKAAAAYRAMHDHGGWVASVGDELAVELDISENADLYAAVGGFDPSEITQGLGAWWSPSATWFQSGRTLVAQAQLHSPAFEDFDEASRLLLEAGAQILTRFFATVAAGGERLLDADGRSARRHGQRYEFAFVVEFARQRARLFREGPDANGRYLKWDEVSEPEIRDALKTSLTTSEAEETQRYEETR